ncbi:hypothetical protein AVEN_18207-1 [Araneus ventricosus]|uniref:Uncharacterized protein n=1 Tax=Araneus ventricosus TaxID=182803 RepID=A0A4Y2AL06_ARAVE|nr:hypothetical protein AVEN_18207-1 [Araneus ventricosus]
MFQQSVNKLLRRLFKAFSKANRNHIAMQSREHDRHVVMWSFNICLRLPLSLHGIMDILEISFRILNGHGSYGDARDKILSKFDRGVIHLRFQLIPEKVIKVGFVRLSCLHCLDHCD